MRVRRPARSVGQNPWLPRYGFIVIVRVGRVRLAETKIGLTELLATPGTGVHRPHIKVKRHRRPVLKRVKKLKPAAIVAVTNLVVS